MITAHGVRCDGCGVTVALRVAHDDGWEFISHAEKGERLHTFHLCPECTGLSLSWLTENALPPTVPE